MTFDEARAQFPVLERHAYLNAGSNGPLARATIEAFVEQAQRDLRDGRSGAAYFERMLALREEVRAGLAAVMLKSPANTIGSSDVANSSTNAAARRISASAVSESTCAFATTSVRPVPSTRTA